MSSVSLGCWSELEFFVDVTFDALPSWEVVNARVVWLALFYTGLAVSRPDGAEQYHCNQGSNSVNATMKITFVSQQQGRRQTIHLTSRWVVAFAVLASGVLLATGWLFSWFMMDADVAGSLTARKLAQWQRDISYQQDKIAELRGDTDIEIDALAIQLAQIQGRVLRLDALGERLTTMSNLDAGEFDFSLAVAQGGSDEAMESGINYQPPEFESLIDQLSLQVDKSEEQLNVLESLLLDRKLQDDVYIEGRPIKKGWMSSPFGRRTDPFSGRPAWHKGVDFAGKAGSDILAVGSGVVIWAGKRSGYGKMVEINHGNGYVTRYGHNSDILVSVGDIISKGQTISLMGSTGRSTGPHVHFEVLVNGRQVNPAHYIYRASR